MSQGVKVILIVAGILAFLAIACVGGVAFLGYYFVDHEGVEKTSKEGEEFGKTTDNFGCQAEVISRLKNIRNVELNESLKARYFFDSCLQTSRPNPNFCDGVASDWTDILNDDKWKEAECQRHGLINSNPCRQSMKERCDFCDAKR